MARFTEEELKNYEEKILKQPQPLPDKKGFKQFLILIGIVLVIFVLVLLRGPRGRLEDGLLFTIASDPSVIKSLQLWHVFEFAKFLPAIGIFIWYSTCIPFFNKHIWKDKDPSANLPPEDFWLRNFKIIHHRARLPGRIYFVHHQRVLPHNQEAPPQVRHNPARLRRNPRSMRQELLFVKA